MKNPSETLLPWLTPHDSVEVIEVLMETAERLRNTAEYASMRKELRTQLLNQAHKLEGLAHAYTGGIVDDGTMRAIDRMAEEKKTNFFAEIVEALENHISIYNRRKA